MDARRLRRTRATLPTLIEWLPALRNYGGMFLVATGILTLASCLQDSLNASVRTVIGIICGLTLYLPSPAPLCWLPCGDGGRGADGARHVWRGFLELYAFAAGRSIQYVVRCRCQRGSPIAPTRI